MALFIGGVVIVVDVVVDVVMVSQKYREKDIFSFNIALSY